MTQEVQQDPTAAALAGVLVVELGRRTGASVCASLLAQLGATVVVAQPVRLDADATSLSDKWNWPALMLAGKQFIAWDDTRLPFLCESADVVITSSDMGAQFSFQGRPSQVLCDVTAWGADAAPQPVCELQMQALTGILATTGPGEGDPLLVPVPLVETLCGIHASGAVLAALRHARSTGLGQTIDMALYDCGFAAMSSFISRLLVEGGGHNARRLGNRHTLSAPWNVYRARDGWILICTGSNVQWQRLCNVMKRPELAQAQRFLNSEDRVAHVGEVDAVVQDWLGTQTVSTCVSAFAKASIPGGPVAPIDGYPREPNLDHRGMVRWLDAGIYVAGSPLRMSRTPGITPVATAEWNGAVAAGAAAPCDRHATTSGALGGLRVLEIGHYTTAPIAARHFAALGADVVKIEPPEGEAARGWAPMHQGQSVFYTVSNSDKRGVSLDMNSEEGRVFLRELVASADVLIENLKPGTLAKHGFSAEALAQINPRLVSCAISGFGADSIYAARPAFDTVVQGMSGLMDLVRSEGVPYKTGISTADVMGAAMAVTAVLGALHERERSGKGQHIDLSMQDIVAWATQTAWGENRIKPEARVLACTDGDLLVLGGAGPLDSTRMTRDQASAAALSQGARTAPILSPEQVVHAGATASRRLHFRVRDARGEWPALAVPLRLTRTPPQVRAPGPELGAHNNLI